MPTLIVNPGRPDERTHELGEGVTVIGRAAECGIAILDRSLSRQHAQLEIAGGRVVVRDLASKNGTFVNGAQIELQSLSDGDRLRCGDVTMSLGRPGGIPVAPTFTRRLDEDVSRTALIDLLGPMKGGTLSGLRLPSSEPVRRSEERLKVLLKVSQLLSAPVTLDVLLERVLGLLFQILDADRGAVLMTDERGELVPRTTRPAGKTDGAFYSTSIARWVIENGEAALFSDARFDERVAGSASVMAQSICSSMCAPLRAKDRTLGALYVDNVTTPNRFGPEDLEFLAAFASQAAVALENAGLYGELERQAVLQSNLLRFFPPSTTRRLQESPLARLEAVETEVTVLFSDITGFTELSSEMAPAEVVRLLHDYFPTMADIVFRHEGTLEKYIGDALMAIWGAPFSQPDDADRALAAAVEMHDALAELNRRWREAGRREIAIHIGLNTGRVAAGNIGSERYLQYATIGDATNVAARVCSVATAGQTVISAETKSRLARAWSLEPLGPVVLKGKEHPLELFRVLGTSA